jgi:hypothetical protein
MEHRNRDRPVLLLDVDGVISLFGFAQDRRPAGSFHSINGTLHYISATAGRHLLRLAASYELVWATGWELTANEYLPYLLGLPEELPCLSFDDVPVFGEAHWKLSAIERFAGTERPLAWIDDSHDVSCRAWAEARPGPTLLVATVSAEGIGDQHVDRLLRWAQRLEDGSG